MSELERRYVVWLSGGGPVIVELSKASGPLSVEWVNPVTGRTTTEESTIGGYNRSFAPPFDGDAVLYISANYQ